MRIKLLVFSGLAVFFLRTETVSAMNLLPTDGGGIAQKPWAGGGGDDKKKDKEKGGKKEKDDESMKDAKTRDVSSKPQQHARYSAKTARQTTKYTQKEIMARAKVRLFFHNMFNTKYGKPVNFRNTRARNRWSRGR
jgi:hypothetical protein